MRTCKVCGQPAIFTINPPYEDQGDYCGQHYAESGYAKKIQQYIEEANAKRTESE